MTNKYLKNDEKFEDLQFNGLKIIQSKNLYRLTSDAVILANFVKAKKTDVLVDLGTGSGIIAILASQKNQTKKTYGIEIQPELADMAKRSVEANNLKNIEILNIDMLELMQSKTRKNNGIEAVDVVVCNPPYKKSGTARLNENQSQKIARHETKINLLQICQVAKSLLKFHGKFYIVCDADRLAELIYDLKQNSLEPKKMFFTQSSAKSKANLVFIEAVLGAKESVLVLPMLITNDKDGLYLQEVKKMKFE